MVTYSTGGSCSCQCSLSPGCCESALIFDLRHLVLSITWRTPHTGFCRNKVLDECINGHGSSHKLLEVASLYRAGVGLVQGNFHREAYLSTEKSIWPLAACKRVH